jgi:hypothetical protein
MWTDDCRYDQKILYSHFHPMHLRPLCLPASSSKLQKYHQFLCSYEQVVHSVTKINRRVMRNCKFGQTNVLVTDLSRPNVHTLVEATRSKKLAVW